MVTGMILPTDNFTNVTIDNGKVISDGSRNIVVGFGMPGHERKFESGRKDIDLEIPESLCMEADVTDFTMSSTFTVCTDRSSGFLDVDDIDGLDDLKDS